MVGRGVQFVERLAVEKPLALIAVTAAGDVGRGAIHLAIVQHEGFIDGEALRGVDRACIRMHQVQPATFVAVLAPTKPVLAVIVADHGKLPVVAVRCDAGQRAHRAIDVPPYLSSAAPTRPAQLR